MTESRPDPALTHVLDVEGVSIEIRGKLILDDISFWVPVKLLLPTVKGTIEEILWSICQRNKLIEFILHLLNIVVLLYGCTCCWPCVSLLGMPVFTRKATDAKSNTPTIDSALMSVNLEKISPPSFFLVPFL